MFLATCSSVTTEILRGARPANPTSKGACHCQCSDMTSTGFTATCSGLSPSSADGTAEITLFKTAASPRPFALKTSTVSAAATSTSVSFQGDLVAGTSYWVAVALHGQVNGKDIAHGWLPPCGPATLCHTLPTQQRDSKRDVHSVSTLPAASDASVTLDVYRVTELWFLENTTVTTPPAALADFLPSHDSADVFGAAWLMTMSNGYPAGEIPDRPGQRGPASGPLPFSLLRGGPISAYTVTAGLVGTPEGENGGFAKYVSCQSYQPPQCFCTSAVDRLIAYETADVVYRDCPPDASNHQHGCNCTPTAQPAFFGPPYPESVRWVGRQPIFNIPPTSTGPLNRIPPGVVPRGYWYSTPVAGRCNATNTRTLSPQKDSAARSPPQSEGTVAAQAGCTWSRGPLVKLIWAEDLKEAGYDFGAIGCSVWVCLPGSAQAAAAMIERNAAALQRAFASLPLAAA